MSGRVRLFVVFLGAYFLSYFFRSTNAVIAEDLSRDLGLSAAQLGFMTSLFFLAFAAAQLPLGSALDRVGARIATPTLMLAGVLGCALFAAAPSYPLLALGRALIGLGMAGVLMGSLKAFSVAFPPHRFATVSTVFVGLGSLGALAAATPLAWLNATIGWRNVFWGGAAITLLSALLIIFWGRVPAAATEAPANAAGGRENGFLLVFANATFWRIALINLAVAGSMFAYQGLWAGPFLSDVMGADEVAVGNLLLLMGLGVTAGYFVSGPLADRVGVPQMLAAGGVVLMLVQLLLLAAAPSWPPLLLPLLFAAFGFFGAFNVLSFAHLRTVFPNHLTGRAITALNLFGIGGSALLQWGLGVLIGAFGRTATGSYPAVAYRTAFGLTAGLCLLAVVAYAPLLWTTRATEPA